MYSIVGEHITFSYEPDSDIPILDNISLRVKQGEWLVLLGSNGCGKSTLLKHLNGLLPLQQGTLLVAGLDVTRPEHLPLLHRRCGMVFQNPDNQFVSTLLAEDIAFGLKNYNTPTQEILLRIKQALDDVGLNGYENRSIHTLSGGQKQRAALAGVLALNPELLLFDEVTSMLDPQGRKEILRLIRNLHQERKQTILMVTHYVEEAVWADQVCLMKDGQIFARGTPRTILTDMKLLSQAGLLPSLPVQLYYQLKTQGKNLAYCPLTEEELVNSLCPLL